VTDGPLTVYSTASFSAGASTQTIASNPPGRTVLVDGQACVSSCTFQWPANSPHTVEMDTQAGANGTQYRFGTWSDGGASLHTIYASSANATYVANFVTQYYLTTSSTGGGTISPLSGWWDSGFVNVTAVPNPGYQLTGFSGSLTGLTNPQILTLNGPGASVTASFGVAAVIIADTTVLPGTTGAAQGNNGLQTTVSLTSISGLPPGTTWTPLPTIPAFSSFDINLQVPDNASPSDYQATANFSGAPSRNFIVHIQPFVLGSIPATALPVTQWKAAAEFTLHVSARTGKKITVSDNGLPGIKVFPDPQVLTGNGTFNIRIVASDSSSLGNQSVVLTFSCDPSTPCSGFTRSISVPITVSAAPSTGYFTLQTNLGPLGLDDYQMPLSGDLAVDGCSPAWTMRECFNSAFKNDSSSPSYRSNNYVGQGVTGIRFNVPAYFDFVPRSHAWDISAVLGTNQYNQTAVTNPAACQPPATAGITVGCGTLTGGPNGEVDKFWSNFRMFLKDLRSYGIRYVMPSIGIDNFGTPAPAPSGQTSNCPFSLGNGTTVYFYPWWPLGFFKDGNNNYGIECTEQPDAYILAQHPPSTIFWGWGPYYSLLDQVFQAIQDAQLQMVEFDILGELDLDQCPSCARWIQDNNTPTNQLSESVYSNICTHMRDKGLAGANGECLATYSTFVADGPPVSGDTSVWADCSSFYPNEPSMLLWQSLLMHAFAGDYFGAFRNDYDPGTFTGQYVPCPTTPLADEIRLKGITPTTLIAPDQLTILSVIDVHGGISNGGTTPDANISRTFFNNLYSLGTSPHYTVKDGTQFQMSLSQPHPIIQGETFSTQSRDVCPNLQPWQQDLNGGAVQEAIGYYGDTTHPSSTLYNNFGARFIIRPWHFVDAHCPTPSQIGPGQSGAPNGPFRPYSNQ